MTDKKNFVLVGLVAIIALSLTACRDDEDPTGPKTPITADFDIGNLEQQIRRPMESAVAVTITPKAKKSGGTITVYYEGLSYLKTITVPQEAGSYVVTFDVAEKTGWKAVSGLHAGTLTISYYYGLGDTGPGGGKIFYRSEDGFTMTDTGEICYYLEAAIADMATDLAWASSAFLPPIVGGTGDYVMIVGTSQAIGSGRRNTALILAKDPDAPAAKACNEYTQNGKADWFLPSRLELKKLYENRTYVGNLEPSDYWSSSQDNLNNSHVLQNYFGATTYDGELWNYKNDANKVRAVRAF